MSLQELVQRILPICGHYSLICRFIEGTVLDIAAVYSVALLCDKDVVIVCLRTSFEKNVVLKPTMTTTLSRQHEMTRAIGAKNDESRTRSQI